MEFTKLNIINDNFGKPAWQACDGISIMACEGNPTSYTSPKGAVTYYHKVQVMTESGVSEQCQFASGSNAPIQPGDYSVVCQVKMYNGKKTYSFKPAQNQQQKPASNQAGQQSEPANDPATVARIIRGNAVNACGACCNDPATFWSMLPLVQRYIETGEMPSA